MNAQGQKTGGRQKGTPNKITAEIREFLASLVFDNMDLIRQDIKDMTAEQRASFLPKILPYIVPKQKPKTEKDEQDIACDHLKSFLSLAQIVNGWEQNQQPSQNPAEAPYYGNGQHPQPSNNSAPSDPSEQSDPSDNPSLSDYFAPSNNSAPSDSSDPSASSDSSDNSELSSPSSTVVPSLTRPAPRTPFYKAIDLKKTHNKRRKRR